MFNVCRSVQLIYEHHHHFETQVELTPRNTQMQHTTITADNNLGLRLPMQHYSVNNFEDGQFVSTFSSRTPRKRGIKVMCVGSGGQNEGVWGKELAQQRIQTENLVIVRNEVSNNRKFGHRYVRSMGSEQYRVLEMEEIKQSNEDSPHRPHALIKQKKYQLLRANAGEREEERPFWLERAGGKAGGEEGGCGGLGREPKHDWRCSAKTNSNNNSEVEQAQGESHAGQLSYGGSNMRINIKEVQTASGGGRLGRQLSLLEQAKTIVSREGSVSLFSEVNVEESVVVQREVGIFDFVTPLEGGGCCDLARAIDNRTNEMVTIKRYDSCSEMEYHHELEVMRTLEALKIERVLRLGGTMVEDTEEGRQMVFIYQPFDRTMAEMVRTEGGGGHSFKASVFLEEVQSLLGRLNGFGVYLRESLGLSDFVWVGGEWRLRCVCKLRVWGSGSARSSGECIGLGKLFVEMLGAGVL